MEMLKVRAALKERLKQEGILSSRASKSDKAQKRLKLVNGRLVMYDDFDDDAIDVGATKFSNGHASSLSTSKLSRIVSTKTNKPKVSKCTWGFYVSNLWSRGTTTGFLPSCCCQRLHSLKM
ncbi:protein THALLO-like isoform X2 [Quercus suber]|uniref:protein THALLO-like isoform X2 n=1 Tax=Quercus suber TaxID=58331 RepID=UPI0032DED067